MTCNAAKVPIQIFALKNIGNLHYQLVPARPTKAKPPDAVAKGLPTITLGIPVQE
jgi:hypothetical protein